MFVEQLLPATRKRLVIVDEHAELIEAARHLGRNVDVVVVCNASGRMSGVVSKTGIVERISHCAGATCTTPLTAAMTCTAPATPTTPCARVWNTMTSRRLRHMTGVDDDCRPLGLPTARQVMAACLDEVEQDEGLLRAYVMCIGHR